MNVNINHIIEAAKAGGAVLTKYFGELLEVEEKTSPKDFRTVADTESEEKIIQILEQYFPEANIFGEEQGKTDKGSDYTFIIDPLDGSNNFTVGIPYFSVSIALIKGNEAIASVIYAPTLNHCYWAEKGRGAFLNGSNISVNNVGDLRHTSLAYNKGYETTHQPEYVMFPELHERQIKRIFLNWSVALDFCLLARGSVEAIINNDCEVYDFIAGRLIALEAGAKSSNFDSSQEVNDFNNKFLITNGTEIHQEMLSVISKHDMGQ